MGGGAGGAALCVLTTAVLLPVLSLLLPLVLQPLPLDPLTIAQSDAIVLGHGGYDITAIDAPAASGKIRQHCNIARLQSGSHTMLCDGARTE